MKEMELRKAMYIPSAPLHLPLVSTDTNLNVNSKPKPAKFLSAVNKKNRCGKFGTTLLMRGGC